MHGGYAESRDAVEKYGIRMEIGRRQLERVDMLLQSQQHALNISDFKSRCVVQLIPTFAPSQRACTAVARGKS